jgi:hypothetical protein
MLSSLMTFLIGILVILCVLYFAKVVVDWITLPEPIRQVALVIIGLFALLALLTLTINVFGTAVAVFPWRI